MERLRSKWPVVVLALAPLVALWRAVFLGETIGPFDQIASMSPWNQPPSGKPWDVLQADGALQFYGWRDLVFEAWRSFQLPLWNPYQLAGTPLLANSQSAGFYPPHILAGVLQLPTGLAMTLLAWAHLAWAGLGVYALCRFLGASRLGAVVGGIGFSLSPFMVAWVALPSVITTVSWVPWVLWGTLTLFRGNYRGSKLARLAVCIAMMLLSGHLQFCAYGLMACAIAALWMFLLGNRDDSFAPKEGASLPVGRLGATLVAVVVGFLIAAPQLLPVLAYSRLSHRQNTPTEQGYGAYVSSAIRPFELISIPAPNLLGNPSSASSTVDGLSTYWPAVVKPGAHFAESAISFGPVILLLLLAAPFRSSRAKLIGLFLSLSAIALLLAVGSPLNRALYFSVPGWSSTGSPARIAFLFVLGICVVASLGVRNVEGQKRAYLKPLVLGAIIFVAAVQAPLTLQLKAWLPQADAVLGRYMASTLFDAGPAALIAFGLAIVALLAAATSDPRAKSALIGSALLAPFLLYASNLVRTSDGPPPKLPQLAPNERIAVVNGSWELLVRAPAVLPPNTASLSRIQDLGGYDSLVNRQIVELLREVNGGDPAPAANGNMMFVKPTADPQKLMDAGVTQVWTNRPLPAFESFPFEDVGGVRIYRLPGEGVITPASDKASVGFSGIDLWVESTASPQTVEARYMNLPGWRAFVDGGELAIREGRWLSVDLPASAGSNLRFRYEPPGLKSGAIMGAVGLVVLLAIRFVRPRKAR